MQRLWDRSAVILPQASRNVVTICGAEVADEVIAPRLSARFSSYRVLKGRGVQGVQGGRYLSVALGSSGDLGLHTPLEPLNPKP